MMFAGEATDKEHYGTVTGAMMAGRRLKNILKICLLGVYERVQGNYRGNSFSRFIIWYLEHKLWNNPLNLVMLSHF